MYNDVILVIYHAEVVSNLPRRLCVNETPYSKIAIAGLESLVDSKVGQIGPKWDKSGTNLI